MSLFAWLLVLVLPEMLLYAVVSRFMRNPRKQAVETTVSMLRNAHIVRQALYVFQHLFSDDI